MRATDWNAYYSKPFKTATVTRKITGRRLISVLRNIGDKNVCPLKIIELGGANSCFFNQIHSEVNPGNYSILDNNKLGLEKFSSRVGQGKADLIEADVLHYQGERTYDVAFSVGLIEHFSPEQTKRCIETHWNLVHPGGFMVLFFPTPTWLYRVTRRISELLGLWIFHDERPLEAREVLEALDPSAIIKENFIIWPIFLTQAVIVAQKPALAPRV
jgi:hypothetical protein